MRLRLLDLSGDGLREEADESLRRRLPASFFGGDGESCRPRGDDLSDFVNFTSVLSDVARASSFFGIPLREGESSSELPCRSTREFSRRESTLPWSLSENESRRFDFFAGESISFGILLLRR